MKKLTSAINWILVLLLARTITPVGLEGIWLDVPFVKQEKNLCGAACGLMVMQYWSGTSGGSRLPENSKMDGIAKELYSKVAGGVFGRDMELYFKEQGFQTFVFRGEWTDLEHHLSMGRPLIACLEAGKKGTPLHYVVIAGIDRQNGFVLLNDPAQRKLLKTRRSSFEKAWGQTEQWTLLAVPQSSTHDALK